MRDQGGGGCDEVAGKDRSAGLDLATRGVVRTAALLVRGKESRRCRVQKENRSDVQGGILRD